MDEPTQWVKADPDGLAEGQVMTVVAGGRALCLTRTDLATLRPDVARRTDLEYML